MGDFIMGTDVLRNRKYLRLTLLARHVWHILVVTAEDEGRGHLDPVEVVQAGALWGQAHVDQADVVEALRQLLDARMLVAYGEPAPDFPEGGLFFMPGRFEHNAGREYWRKSKLPLPALEQLQEHPEYLEGLRMLTSKGRLDLDPAKPRRYPKLAAGQAPQSPPITENHGPSRDATDCHDSSRLGVGVGVGVGVEQERGIFPLSGSSDCPTEKTRDMLRAMARQRGLDLAEAAGAAGVDLPITAGDPVSAMRGWLEAQPRLTPEDRSKRERAAARRQRQQELDQVWQQLADLLPNPDPVAEGLARLDGTTRRAMLQRLEKHLASEASRLGRHLPEIMDNVTGGAYWTADHVPAVLAAVYEAQGGVQ